MDCQQEVHQGVKLAAVRRLEAGFDAEVARGLEVSPNVFIVAA